MKAQNTDSILAKRYQIKKSIGFGAMGQVYLANDLLLGGVPVAVKFLSLSTHNQKIQMQERFEQEAKTCALLGQKSIHIVRVMDYGVNEGTPFYVMEYLQGKSLNNVIRSHTLSLARFLSLSRQISLGLQCAHQGIPIDGKNYPIVHRDIKPSNVLVIEDPSLGELAKILDFGIAKLLQADNNQTKYYMGTFAYSSPEQMEGSELDNRSDIYSLGVMLFEMITGIIPVQANTESFGGWYKAHHFQSPRSFEGVRTKFTVPPEVNNLVMSCLAKLPKDRPQSVSEIVQILISLEQRTATPGLGNQHFNQTISNSGIASSGVNSLKPSVSTDAICRLVSWPKNKPIANIVFPDPIQINEQAIAALWVMLPQTEIIQRLQNRFYNQFLFINSPHPMMLWLSVLYHRTHGAKWLPYYLDLKTSFGQEITQLMAEKGNYRVLLFGRESPECASTCLLLNIAPTQRQLLQQWVSLSQTIFTSTEPQLAKNLLKQEYEKLKPQILMKLEKSYG
jgi:serine/threonine-protein kinase